MPDGFATRLRIEAHAVWLAVRDPRTPWPARLIGLAIAAYALSPIDLIPDFIPVIGLLDDALLIPAGLWLMARMIPPAILDEHRAAAREAASRPVSRGGIALVVTIWIVVLALAGWAIARRWR